MVKKENCKEVLYAFFNTLNKPSGRIQSRNLNM